MPYFSQHEVQELQDQIRTQSGLALTCRQMAQMAEDPDLHAFCAEEAQRAEQTAFRLMSLLGETTH